MPYFLIININFDVLKYDIKANFPKSSHNYIVYALQNDVIEIENCCQTAVVAM